MPELRAGSASLWRDRDYLVLWSGQVVSTLGGAGSLVAFPLLVIALTGSAASAGVAAALTTLPYALLSVPAGALVSRWDLRRVMMTCDLGRAAAKASIPLAAAFDALSLGQLYGVAVVESALFAFFSVAERSLLPRVVAPAQLGQAISHQQTSLYLASLLGPAIGGLLYGAAGPTSPFALDALTFALSAASLLALRTPPQVEATRPVQGRAPGIAYVAALGVQPQLTWEAIRWLVARRFTWATCLLNGAFNFVLAANALLLVLLVQAAHGDAAVVGLVFAMGAAGGLLGSFAGAWVQRRWGPARVSLGVAWTVALLLPLYLFPGSALMFGLVTALLSAAMPIFSVSAVAHRTRQVPDALQTRVTGITNRILSFPRPVGALVAGLALERWGTGATILGLTAFAVLSALWMTVARSTRQQLAVEAQARPLCRTETIR